MSDDAVWLQAVLDDFDAFLVDHAANERKASASAMSLVAHYPDRTVLVARLIDLAIEELNHFRQVNNLLRERNLALTHDVRDPYVRSLRAEVRDGSAAYFLDQLLVASVIEARGVSRFSLLANAAPLAPALRRFYSTLAASESRHTDLFLDLARLYFEADEVTSRHGDWITLEAEIARAQPPGPRLH
ncbi:MAG: tRNA-(ms[2]io[6]A)-hydroxylase [Gammaproteobacteria bacterium]|nr:tRNA-(ms[2]io[6]A)-hydroxylase [Gammaproteobacteria bacterium]